MSAEIELDLAEVKTLLASAKRPATQKALTELQTRLTTQLDQAKFKEASAAAPAHKPAPVITAGRPQVKLTTYAYDESAGFVKLYYTINGVQNIPAERIQSSFTEDTFDISALDVEGKDYHMSAKGFVHPIDPTKSVVKQKSDMLLVMLKKPDSSTWSNLFKLAHEAQKREEEKFKNADLPAAGDDPQAGLMGMMKNLYDQGDDEMKRSIRKAFAESQSKKAAGDGAGDFPMM